MNLDKLLKPRSVAIIGANDKPGFGGDTTKNYLKFSRNQEYLYLIHPKKEEVFGKKVYRSILDVPEDVDLAIICTSQKTVLPLLEDCAKKKAGGVVVFASGYSEVGAEGKILQEELVKRADELGIAVMGPNCAGFANFNAGVFAFAFLVEERDRKGNIGMVSQSGQIVLGGLDTRAMGFSTVISSGNSCNVKVEDYLDYLVEDEDTKVVCAYMEGVTKPSQLVETFRKAAKKKKPIVMLKTGKSAKSQQLAASHTGSLSGADRVVRSVFKRYGVIEAEDLEEMMGIATALSWLRRLPEGQRLAYLCVSGGEAGVMADLTEQYQLPLAEYSPEVKAYLQTLVPDYGTVNNPFDMTAGIGYNTPVMVDAMRAISRDENVDALAICYTITPQVWDDTITHMVEAASIVSKDEDMKPIFWIPYIEHTRDVESADALKAAGVPLLPTGCYGCNALRKILDFAVFEFEDTEGAIPERLHKGSVGCSEYESLCYLDAHGVAIPPQAVAATEEEAVEAVKRLGYPLSVKIHSADIQHKSDVGGVRLNLRDEAGLRDAFRTVMDNCGKNAPQARLEGVLLKPMLKTGVEMIIGVNNDKDFGPMIMVGMGGVFVELFKDVQLACAPLTRKQAIRMIDSLKSAPLLDGYRGSEPCNKEALAELLVKISEMAASGREEIRELDINPVFVTPEGVAIADALLVKYED